MTSDFIIYEYSRAEAIADGVLIDVSEAAKLVGFRYPVAMTATVWGDCVAVPSNCPWLYETTRLGDLLYDLRQALKRIDKKTTDLEFVVGEKLTLKAICSPGDDIKPVITIMYPHED